MLVRFDIALNGDGEKSIAGRASVAAFAVRVISAVIALVSQVFLARWMGGFDYGIFVMVWVSMLIIGNLACFGFHTSLVCLIPQYKTAKQFDFLRGLMFTGRFTALVLSSILSVLGIAGIWYFSNAIEPYYQIPYILGLTCLPMIALSDVLQGISRANAWSFAALVPVYILRPVLILLFFGLAVVFGFPSDARTAIFCAVCSTYITTISQLIYVSYRVREHLNPGKHAFEVMPWIKVAMPIFFIEGFYFMLTNADVLIVGHFLNPEKVGIYFATVKILALVHFVSFAVRAGGAQRFAALAHTGDQQQLEKFARETVSWTFWPSLVLAIFLALFGEFFLALFGSEFVAGYELLLILLVAVVIRSLVGPADSLLAMSGGQNICAIVYALMLCLNIGLSFSLIPIYGLWGAALASALTLVCEAGALLFAVWMRHGFIIAIFAPKRFL